jgi:hypothetical protein
MDLLLAKNGLLKVYGAAHKDRMKIPGGVGL